MRALSKKGHNFLCKRFHFFIPKLLFQISRLSVHLPHLSVHPSILYVSENPILEVVSQNFTYKSCLAMLRVENTLNFKLP